MFCSFVVCTYLSIPRPLSHTRKPTRRQAFWQTARTIVNGALIGRELNLNHPANPECIIEIKMTARFG